MTKGKLKGGSNSNVNNLFNEKYNLQNNVKLYTSLFMSNQ